MLPRDASSNARNLFSKEMLKAEHFSISILQEVCGCTKPILLNSNDLDALGLIDEDKDERRLVLIIRRA